MAIIDNDGGDDLSNRIRADQLPAPSDPKLSLSYPDLPQGADRPEGKGRAAGERRQPGRGRGGDRKHRQAHR
jgi:hypothetical protein